MIGIDKKINYFLLLTGSIFVALSGTIVGISAFKGETLIEVIIGYTVFVIGYKTCWYSINKNVKLGNLAFLSKFYSKMGKIKTIEPWKYLMIGIDIYLAAHGTVEFGSFVSEPELLEGLEAGVSTFAGYVIAHEGVNEVPI